MSSTVVNSNATSHGQTVDLATAKVNNLYDGGNVPRLNGPEKFRRSSKGHMHDNTSGSSTAVNSGITDNGLCDNDGDLIAQHCGHVPSASSRGSSGGGLCNGGDGGGGGNWSGAQSPALSSNTSGQFGGGDDGSSAMAAAAQEQAALAGLSIGVSGFNLGLSSQCKGFNRSIICRIYHSRYMACMCLCICGAL